MSTVSDPVVATFPTIMDDPQQRVMLHRLWDRHVSGLKAPTVSPGFEGNETGTYPPTSPGSDARTQADFLCVLRGAWDGQQFSQLVLMFRQVVTMMWPAAHAQAVPQSSIMNFNVHQVCLTSTQQTRTTHTHTHTHTGYLLFRHTKSHHAIRVYAHYKHIKYAA
jgi:hypothetical protein